MSDTIYLFTCLWFFFLLECEFPDMDPLCLLVTQNDILLTDRLAPSFTEQGKQQSTCVLEGQPATAAALGPQSSRWQVVFIFFPLLTFKEEETSGKLSWLQKIKKALTLEADGTIKWQHLELKLQLTTEVIVKILKGCPSCLFRIVSSFLTNWWFSS